MNALELHGVVKRYGRREALAGLDLQVPAGSIFGLVGSNGAGKTTSMAVSVGLLHAAAGTINLLGDGPFNPARHTGRVALLPQDSRLPLHARVEELLQFYGELQGLAPADLSASVAEVLDWVHLKDRCDSPVRTLSHGMIRRLTIAQAFLGRPELVLLDEPMSGLDPREAARVRSILMGRRGTQTIVISSHNLHEIETLCDHVAFIEAGKLVRQDTLSLITKRRHSITYRIVPGPADGANLSVALPELVLEISDDRRHLTVRFDDSVGQPSAVNARVLPVLLGAGIGIEEIRLGSDLETAYFDVTAGH